jgi:hypothetical protein
MASDNLPFYLVSLNPQAINRVSQISTNRCKFETFFKNLRKMLRVSLINGKRGKHLPGKWVVFQAFWEKIN